jgi:signal transduction histidine kinase
MFPLPIYHFKYDTMSSSFEDGPLVSLPSELSTSFYTNLYRGAKPGWSKCPLGYSYYAREISSGAKYVVPGVVLLEDTPRKKLYFPPIRLNKSKIEGLIDGLLLEQKSINQKLADTRRDTEAELNILVHDLRQFSAAIYNAAFQARSEFDRPRYPQARELIETVLATQAMLSVRIDSLDLASNPSLLISQSISVYRKVDKMVRSFQPMANNKRINLSISGSSFGSTYGPDVFELIPFAVVENAIKYSPVGHDVVVRVSETEKVIRFDVTSLGPEIENDEFEKIFERHYRGKNATDTGRAGSGIGLSNAHMLVQDHFGGRIWATQETALRVQIGLVQYHNVSFHVEVPRRN